VPAKNVSDTKQSSLAVSADSAAGVTPPCTSNNDTSQIIPLATWSLWALLVLLLGLRRVWDIDYWWQLATGRAISVDGLSRADVFTFTRAGSPRIESAWLYCRGLAFLNDSLGVGFCVALKAVIMLGAFGLLARMAARRCGWLAACIVLTIAVVASSQRFVLRPEIVSYGCLAIGLYILEREERAPTRWLFVLPVVQCLWTNCHSYFPLGLLVAGLWALQSIFKGRRSAARAWSVVVLSVAATFVNPYGPRMHEVAFNHLRAILDPALIVPGAVAAGVFAAGGVAIVVIARKRADRPSRNRRASVMAGSGLGLAVLAWWVVQRGAGTSSTTGWLAGLTERNVIGELSPTLLSPVVFTATIGWAALVMVWLFLGVVGAGKIRWWTWLFSCAMLALSFMAIRNLPLFAFAAIPVIAESVPVARTRLRAWLTRGAFRMWLRDSAARDALRTITAGLCAAACLYLVRDLWTDRFHLRQGDSNQRGLALAPHAFTTGSADFLDTCGGPREVFCGPDAGSVLLARGHRVYTDPRQVAGLLDEFLELADAPARLPAELDRLNVDVAVIELRWLGFMRVLLARPDWLLAHADSEAATFFRRGVPGPTDVRARARPWAAGLRASVSPPRPLAKGGPFARIDQPFPSERAGHLSLMLGDYAGAREYFREARAAYPDAFTSGAELARCEERLRTGPHGPK